MITAATISGSFHRHAEAASGADADRHCPGHARHVRRDGFRKSQRQGSIAPAGRSLSVAVPEQDVVNMNRRLAAPDNSLNAPVRADSEGEWQDWLVDDAESQETVLADREELTGRKALLSTALKTLNERERHILIERRLKDNPTTLEDLSQQYNISRERVRQIEVRAFEKLQKAMTRIAGERRLLPAG